MIGLTFGAGAKICRRAASGEERQSVDMNENDEDHVLRAQLAALMQEHRDLDTAIAAMIDSGVRDQLQLSRLKKRKLQLKDQIARIEDALLPDIIA
jgi:hypothetical protein